MGEPDRFSIKDSEHESITIEVGFPKYVFRK
jgi:hypothetical protein